MFSCVPTQSKREEREAAAADWPDLPHGDHHWRSRHQEARQVGAKGTGPLYSSLFSESESEYLC